MAKPTLVSSHLETTWLSRITAKKANWSLKETSLTNSLRFSNNARFSLPLVDIASSSFSCTINRGSYFLHTAPDRPRPAHTGKPYWLTNHRFHSKKVVLSAETERSVKVRPAMRHARAAM